MGENPMLELMLYNRIKDFIVSNGSAELWEASVQPILRQMAAQGLATGEAALANTGLWVEGALITDAELVAAEAAGATALPAILKRLGIRAASSFRPGPPVIMAAVAGLSILATTNQVSAATKEMNPENNKAYKEYVHRYMGYLMKGAAMGLRTERFPPPKTFKQWLNRDQSGAWWQG